MRRPATYRGRRRFAYGKGPIHWTTPVRSANRPTGVTAVNRIVPGHGRERRRHFSCHGNGALCTTIYAVYAVIIYNVPETDAVIRIRQ